MLKRLVNPRTKRREYAMVGGNGRVLKYFGIRKPSEEEFRREEERVQYFANKSKAK